MPGSINCHELKVIAVEIQIIPEIIHFHVSASLLLRLMAI